MPPCLACSRSPHNVLHSPSILYIYLPYVRRSVNAKLSSFNPKYCARRSVLAKYRKQLRKSRTLEPFHLNVDTQNNSRKAPKSAQEQEDRRWRRKRQSPTCCRDSGPKERKVEKAKGAEGPCQTRYSNC